MKSPIVNFSKGEIAPQLYSRIDASQYSTGLKKARNVIVQRYGGASARPGFRIVGKLPQQSEPARLVPFQYSIDQGYVLLMQQAIVRPMAFGGYVLEDDDLKIVSATLTNPIILEIPYHAFAIGDELYISGLTGMQDMERRFVTVTGVPDANHVAIDLDGTGFTALTGSTGITRVAPPAPPPPPPPPPPPTPAPPDPPFTGGIGGTGGLFCVVDDTLILMNKSGRQMEARFLKAGARVYTQHGDGNGAWGYYPVDTIETAFQPVFRAEGYPRATGEHMFWVDGAWVRMKDIGEPDGSAWVSKITIRDAHTYVSAGVLSHNKLLFGFPF